MTEGNRIAGAGHGAIELRTVTKRFGDFVAVDRISFSVGRGEIVSLLGPSGCGKTTTLRMIAGFEQPETGSIEIDGQEAVGLRPYERSVGLVFQHFALFPHMTVADNVAYGMKYRGVPQAHRGDRMREILELVKLTGLENRRPSQLSGGQQQRVALARALVTNPSIMLLDEPLSALDAKLRQSLQIELRMILKRVECSTIIVTHDQQEAMSLGDRMVVMNAGRIEQQGTPAEIYSRPQTRFVADFVGQFNWFEVDLLGSDATDRWAFRTRAGEIFSAAARDRSPPGSARIGIRPESMTIVPSGQAAGPGLNRIEGSIKHVVFLGQDIEYSVEIGHDRSIIVVEKNRNRGLMEIGDAIGVQFDPQDITIIDE